MLPVTPTPDVDDAAHPQPDLTHIEGLAKKPPTTFRAGASNAKVAQSLGLLAELRGTWIGSGFNLIARPDHQHNKPFFLELNATKEILTFMAIGAPIPNRGSAQDDISFLGLHYFQQVSDAATNGGLHLEPGIWLNVPATTAPAAPPSIVRLSTIPHGDALLAQGQGFQVKGGPHITPTSSTPINHATGQPVTDAQYLQPYKDTPLPPYIPQGAIENPNVVLEHAIQGQTITDTIALVIETAPVGGIQNIPFVVTNANATLMKAIFWIEFVKDPDGDNDLIQLQYTQLVMLNFLGIDWPHISVATLIKN